MLNMSMLMSSLHLLAIGMLVLSMLLNKHAQSKHSKHTCHFIACSHSSNKAMDNQTAIRMELNKIILLLAMQCTQKLISAQQEKKRKRKIWVRDWISRRQDLGASAQLLTEMRVEDAAGYKNHLRMLSHQFDFLLSLRSILACKPVHTR